jgi:hypothetical protein
MIAVTKLDLRAGLYSFVIRLRSWLSKKITMIKALSVAMAGLILILSVRVIALFLRGAEPPEIYLHDIET